MSLTPHELERYARHIMLREIGGPGQKRLLQASVALVGLGALGGPAALYLAAAGVGRLVLIDDDLVSLSNLQRQVLFTGEDIGRPKTEAGAGRLASINPAVRLQAHPVRLTPENAAGLLRDADLVIDGSDSFATRFAVNEACHQLGLALVSGAVGRWSAQLSVFKSGLTKGAPVQERLACYRCLVPEAPVAEETCAMVGVAGPLTGIVGARLALEAVKEITSAGQSMAGRLWVFDALSGEGRTLALRPDPDCSVCS